MDDDLPKLTFAENDADFRAFGTVCSKYVGWCRNRYGDMPWFVEEVFGHQSLSDELGSLWSKYSRPAGRALVATKDDLVVAGGAYRRLCGAICELKRIYVTDEARGRGLGRRLSETLIASAKADGYTTMQLDTGNRLAEAIAMYKALGLTRIAPTQSYPERLMPYLVRPCETPDRNGN